MKDLLIKWFGASWITTVLGYVVIIGSVAQLVIEAIQEHGVPTDMKAWLGILIGIGIKLTKQQNVTNANEPVAAKVIEGPKPIKTVAQEQ